MFEITMLDVAHLVIALMFFATGIAYGSALSSRMKPDRIAQIERCERIMALRLLDNLFSSPESVIDYEQNSKVLSAIKDLGGDYYYGALIFDKDSVGIEDLDDKIEAAFEILEELK
jgi:hypothetical protein